MTSPNNYARERERLRRLAAERSIAGREIGRIPPVQQPARKAAADGDFRRFCESYLSALFTLDWSADHYKIIAKTEAAVMRGGLFALAMPRGSGKTTIAEAACLWAILYGYSRFVTLIGSDAAHAEQMLESIKLEIEQNAAILADFPEVAFPIHGLAGIAQRSHGQLCGGQRTLIRWTGRQVILPTIADSPASGSTILATGLTGSLRGMIHKTADGQTVRPSLVVIDDPQTDQSARSPSQCAARESILAGAVLGLAGPGKRIAGIMPLTVIRPDDLADRILDRQTHPDWQGERCKMVYSFPSNTKLWDQYAELRTAELAADGDASQATTFYRQHQAELDEGARVAWPARYDRQTEASAIQHAMNLLLRDKAAFFAEYQNEPIIEDEQIGQLRPQEIVAKQSGMKRGEVPRGVEWVTSFIDVHDAVLYWIAAGWAADFTGAVLDYGTWPKQPETHFTLENARETLARAYPDGGKEAAIYAGLEKLTGLIKARPFVRDDGAQITPERILIDARYLPDTVYLFRRNLADAAVWPAKGQFIGAANKPISEYKKKPGERIGHHWRVPPAPDRRTVRHLQTDVNYWKSFVRDRIRAPMGAPGCLSFFRDTNNHRLLADHLCAEYFVPVEGRGRRVDEWKPRPGNPDNHWFDGLVGCAAAAAHLGAVLPGTEQSAAQEKKPRPRLSDKRKGQG